MIVIDASALYPVMRRPLHDPLASVVRRFLRDEDDPLAAPILLAYEMAHLVHAKYARHHGDLATCSADLDRLLAGIRLMGPDLPRLGATAARHGLTGYDAAYLELAQREGARLLTNDDRLFAAGRQALGAGRAVLLRRLG